MFRVKRAMRNVPDRVEVALAILASRAERTLAKVYSFSKAVEQGDE